MAEAFLQIAIKNLSSLIEKEIGLILGVDDEMKKLASAFTSIQAVLEDAELKQPESREIRDWLRKLNDLAYEVDDILDECATHVSKMKHRDSTLRRLSLKKLLFRHSIARRIRQVNEKLDAVAAERQKFHYLRERPVDGKREVAATRETGSTLNEPDHVYGREEEKEKIVDMLVNQVKEKKEISVLPIIGVGGLGKTTLAQLLFNDQRVVEHFEQKLWVCVSYNFDVKTLVKAMIESATGSGSASELFHLDTLQRRLSGLLNQKRYLLVLDDVWNEHQEKWFELRNILTCGSTGASIIVTTRLKKVADIMGTLPAHHLMGLSEEHCWMLLRQRAFGEEKEVCPNLKAIGKLIVKKCAGVPLAAKTLGGLLRFKRKEEDWVYVKESEIWELPQEEALILPALRLSYHHLPLELRQCFAYCAVFPKDTEIKKQELIFLWMAHGYISSNGKLEMEEVGDEICNELVLRSLLQDCGSDTFNMHDLVHDLAQSIMDNKVPGTQDEGNVTSGSNSKIRQASLPDEYVAFPVSTQEDMEMPSILMKFSRLRVLEASLTSIRYLPSEVGHLKHLRYLNLSRADIHTLPKSLCGLWNLLILNLDECKGLVTLPKNMRHLKNLRHLLLGGCMSLSEMPSKIRELTCLKTLSLFVVGPNRGSQLEELQRLNLGGKLEIQHLERVENYMDAKKANLVEKKSLRALILEWESERASKLGEDIDEKILEALEPHPKNLETLSITGFNGRLFPVWMANSSLQKVTEIDIRNCPNCLRLPQLGQLPHLKLLRLAGLGLVEYVTEEDEVIDGGNPVTRVLFPSLEKLELRSLPNLKGLLKEQVTREAFPNLVELAIFSCGSSLILPPLSSIKELNMWDCSSLTLASISKLGTLTYLRVNCDKTMKCIPIDTLENLTKLKSLVIYRVQELSLPEQGLLRGLKSLTELCITSSETMTCLPEGWLRHLTALEKLSMSDCSELVELPEDIKYLRNLKFVELCSLPKMVSLPEAFQQLTSLQTLELRELRKLESLPEWLGRLTSLETLFLWDCPRLVSLPASIRGLPNLQRLTICVCPKLGRRCNRATGEDWHKIAHIPHLKIIPSR